MFPILFIPFFPSSSSFRLKSPFRYVSLLLIRSSSIVPELVIIAVICFFFIRSIIIPLIPDAAMFDVKLRNVFDFFFVASLSIFVASPMFCDWNPALFSCCTSCFIVVVGFIFRSCIGSGLFIFYHCFWFF